MNARRSQAPTRTSCHSMRSIRPSSEWGLGYGLKFLPKSKHTLVYHPRDNIPGFHNGEQASPPHRSIWQRIPGMASVRCYWSYIYDNCRSGQGALPLWSGVYRLSLALPRLASKELPVCITGDRISLIFQWLSSRVTSCPVVLAASVGLLVCHLAAKHPSYFDNRIATYLGSFDSLIHASALLRSSLFGC